MNASPFRTRALSSLSVLALIAALIVPLEAGSAPQRAQFGTRVEVLQIQVRVADASGNFVSGLTAADFSIKVDGDNRDITTVYEVDLNESAGLTPSAVADAGPPPPAAWRQFLLFFDAGFNSPRGVREAQQAALTFMDEQVQPSDLIGVATYNVVSGTRLLVPFTTDRRQVLEALGGLGLRQAVGRVDRAGFMAETMTEVYTFDEGSAPGNAGFAAEAVDEIIAQVSRLDNDQYAAVAAQYSEQLGELGTYLQAARGTKHVVLFSKGFADEVISGASLDEMAANSAAMDANAAEAIAGMGDGNFGNIEVRSALQESLETLRDAGAVIHVVDPSGVGGERDAGLSSGGRSGGTFSSAGTTKSALTMLADGTDGTLSWNTNAPATALATIEESTRQFYVLAFPRQRGDDSTLELDVEVNRGGVEIVSAPSSFAPPPAYDDMSDEQKQIQLAEFIAKGIVESDLQFEASVAPFFGQGSTSRVGLVIEVPWGQLEELAKSRGDGKATFDIFGYVLDENGSMTDMTNNQITLDIDRLGRGNAKGLPFRYYDLLWAKPGVNEVRALIREDKLGRISAVSRRMPTPRYTGGPLVVSGPVAMDEEHHGLIMEGIDPASPPEHKAEGPVAYPYVFKDIRWTPATHAEAAAGDTQQLYVALYGMSRHPLTGQPQPPSISLHLFDAAGQELQLADVQLIDQADGPMGGLEMVLGAVLPGNLREGYYTLRFRAEDAISSTTVEQDVELRVIDD